MPPPSLTALEPYRDEELPFQGACAGIPPQGQTENVTDVKILNQLVVGLNPNEVFAAFQTQWERINFAESIANHASSIISQLRSQIQKLVEEHNSQMTQAHDRMVQEIGVRDMMTSQLTGDNSQLLSVVEQLKVSQEKVSRESQEISQRSQFQINHLESELSQARVVDAKRCETIRQLEESLAALRHTSSAASVSAKAPSSQPVGQQEDLVQTRILEAIQHLVNQDR